MLMAAEIGFSYFDTDHNGYYSPSDPLISLLCHNGLPFILSYMEQPTSLMSAPYLISSPIGPGWNGLVVADLKTDELTPLTDSEMLELTAGIDCQLK